MASLASLETVDGVIDMYSSQSKRVKTSVQTKKDDLSFEKVKALYKGIDDIIYSYGRRTGKRRQSW